MKLFRNSLEIWTLPFFRSEKVRKFELCHFFYVGKKLGILDLIILNGGKRCGNWTLSFFMLDKAWKVGL
jgi:hypothetical protein